LLHTVGSSKFNGYTAHGFIVGGSDETAEVTGATTTVVGVVLYLYNNFTVVGGRTVSIESVNAHAQVTNVSTSDVVNTVGCGWVEFSGEAVSTGIRSTVDAVIGNGVTKAVHDWAGNEVRSPDSSDTATVTVVHQGNGQGLDTDRSWREFGSYTEFDDLYVEVSTAVRSANTDGVLTNGYVGSGNGVVTFTVRLNGNTYTKCGRVVSNKSTGEVSIKLNTNNGVRTSVSSSELKNYSSGTTFATASKTFGRLSELNRRSHFVVDLNELYVAEETTAISVIVAVVIVVTVVVVIINRLIALRSVRAVYTVGEQRHEGAVIVGSGSGKTRQYVQVKNVAFQVTWLALAVSYTVTIPWYQVRLT